MNILIFIEMIILLIGGVFLIVSSLIKKESDKIKKVCTYLVEAEIIDIDTVRKSDAGPREYGINYYSSYNYYEYFFNNEKIKTRSNNGCIPGKFKIGQKQNIYINPNKPKEIYVKEENIEKISKIFKLVGIFLVIIAIILLSIIIKFK